MATDLSTKSACLDSLVQARKNETTIHKVQKGSSVATNCIVVFSDLHTWWYEKDGTSILDDILYHGTNHDTDVIFLRDRTLHDTMYFGSNLVFENGNSVDQFDFDPQGSTNSLANYLTEQKALYSGGEFIYLGTGPIASFAATWHAILGEGEQEPSCDALIAWDVQHDLQYIVDTLADNCDKSEAPIIQKIKNVQAKNAGNTINLYNSTIMSGSNYPLSLNWIGNNSAAWPTTTKLGYWSPGGPTTCDNNNYYFYHTDNFAGTGGTGVGFGKYDAHISINNYDMKTEWVNMVRDALGIIVTD